MKIINFSKPIGFVLILVIFATFLIACGGKTKLNNPISLPAWFQNPPEDPNYMFSTATMTSKDLQLALNKAKQQARVDLAQQMETKIKSMTKQFTEEVGLGEDAEFLSQTSVVSKSVTSKVLNGSRARQVETIKEDGVIYRAYVLMELPIGPANSALLDAVKKQQNLYTRFRSSQGFQELEEEVEKYDQFKKEQGLIP